MANNSKIEWTEITWNPVTGCNKVSQGCKNCYAEIMHKRLQAMGKEKYQQDFSDGAVEHPDMLMEPFKWKKPRTVFVNSMSDLFHTNLTDAFIDKVFSVMIINTHHTFQVLTKRDNRLKKYFAVDIIQLVKRWEAAADELGIKGNVYQYRALFMIIKNKRLPDNIWIGVSVEDESQVSRIQNLTYVPGIRFLSMEPLLGPVRIGKWITQLNWVIVGGESGHKARPMHPDWARSLRDECAAAGVPFFFKQWGQYKPMYQMTDAEYLEACEKSNFIRSGDSEQGWFGVRKKAAGRLLDGVDHNELPRMIHRDNGVKADFIIVDEALHLEEKGGEA